MKTHTFLYGSTRINIPRYMTRYSLVKYCLLRFARIDVKLHLGEYGVQLTLSFLNYDPKSRPSFQLALKHPFFCQRTVSNKRKLEGGCISLILIFHLQTIWYLNKKDLNIQILVTKIQERDNILNVCCII